MSVFSVLLAMGSFYNYNVIVSLAPPPGYHDSAPDDVLHQLPAAQVLGPVTVGALLWDLDQHLDVLLRDPVNLELHVTNLSAAAKTGKMSNSDGEKLTRMDTSRGQSHS